MSYVQNPQEAPKPPLWRWFLFPILTILFFGGITLIPRLWVALGYSTDEQTFMALTFTQLAVPIGILVLAIWWFAFSGVAWVLRLGLPAVMVGAVGVASYYCVRKMELSTTERGMLPTVYFVWEPTAEDALAQHLQAAAATKTDLPVIDATVGPDDFPNYRGAKFDGVVTHLQLQTDWTKAPPIKLWQQPCPGGYSGVAVAGNIVVTQEQRGDHEVVACYDRATGRQRWVSAYDDYWKDKFGDGSRATPTLHDGRIFALGGRGELACLDAVSGDKLWSVNILKDSKAPIPTWGISGSPLIVDDLVVVEAGVNPKASTGLALAAYEQKTGVRKWAALSTHPAGYSSPRLATLDGVRQILMFHGDALAGHDPKTGAELWTIPWKTEYEMNSIQPIVLGPDQVFISSETKVGSGLFRIKHSDSKKWEVAPLWHNKKIGTRFANPVSDGTHIFCLHSIFGVITCLNAADGTVRWQGPRMGPGQMLLVGDTLLVTNGDTGAATLFAANGDECKELATFPTFDAKTWNTPALAGDQLFVRNQFEIVCLKLPKR